MLSALSKTSRLRSRSSPSGGCPAAHGSQPRAEGYHRLALLAVAQSGGWVRQWIQSVPYIQGCPGPAAGKHAEQGNSFAGLPPTRRLLCTSESAVAWEVFSFSFLAGAFTATALAVINFVTNRNDRCIDMHPESSSCFNNRSAGRAHRLLFIRYHIRY